jgi:hypothetical protein
MGLFNKLKNALFEEEEIDLEPDNSKVVIKDEEVEEKKETPIKEEIPLENERELFKAENTFNFPEFDEEEFVTSYEQQNKARKEKEDSRRVEYNRVKPVSYEYESKVKVTREKPVLKKDKVAPKEEVKKAFKPSPVISPVYGILDKNYKKEDIVTVEKDVKVKKVFDVDMARKKAFGTLEDDIEKTMNEPIETFYNEDSKSIDELLNDTIDDTIEIKYANDYNEDIIDKDDLTNNIEEELDKVDENLEGIEMPKKPKYDEKYLEDNTLESDLFDLIDSMYDNREDE